MDSTTTTLTNLCEKLPDPNLSLYFQRLPKFDTFTLFPKLPFELCLAVWKLTLKPRRTKIKELCHNDSPAFSSSYRVSYSYVSHASLPVGFQINAESREYALQEYKASMRDSTERKCVKYFHPELDTLVLLNLPLVDLMYFERNCRSSCILGVLAGVQNLEMPEGLGIWARFLLPPASTLSLRPIPILSPSSTPEKPGDVLKRRFRGIAKARRLTKLNKFSMGCKDYRPFTEEEIRHCEHAVREIFEAMAADIPDVKVPEVITLVDIWWKTHR
ncbi:hypothetical protein BDZ45DRAFT_749998 [Acephala macrosclerotiorum]|nr:hypothetical protein BDZ45DRAFT_749998 [Acephala macrosclerotiorum]